LYGKAIQKQLQLPLKTGALVVVSAGRAAQDVGSWELPEVLAWNSKVKHLP